MYYEERRLANEFGLGFDNWDAELAQWPGEASYVDYREWECPFSEAELDELAMELLGVSSEAELDQFLGDVFKKAWGGIKKVGAAVAPALKPLGDVLKGVAKAGLPILAGAAGSALGGPVGGLVGGQLGSLVSSALEMETEGLYGAERDFEMARNFVKLAGLAARQAAKAPNQGVSPTNTLRKAVQELKKSPASKQGGERGATAATQSTTALGDIDKSDKGPECGCSYPPSRSGRWLRRGNRIVLFGVG